MDQYEKDRRRRLKAKYEVTVTTKNKTVKHDTFFFMCEEPPQFGGGYIVVKCGKVTNSFTHHNVLLVTTLELSE